MAILPKLIFILFYFDFFINGFEKINITFFKAIIDTFINWLIAMISNIGTF